MFGHGAKGVVGALLCTLSTAWADAPLPRVDITGSRLPVRPHENQADAMTPVQVFSQDDIRRSGAATLREWLEQLPAHAGGSNEIGGSASFAAGSSSASLRNLGKQATLLLLNSRRVAPYPLADYAEVFSNLDALPFEAIERIEILKAGGAAMYGSDAVAGVINIITRQHFSGVQMRASHQRSLTSGQFGKSSASLTAGFALPGSERGRVLANAEVYQRDGLVWSQVLKYVRPELSELSGGFGTGSTYSWPGNVVGGAPIPGCTAENIRNGLCFYDRYERFEVLPAAKRANMLLSSTLPLAGGLEAFSELLLARNETRYLSPFMAYGPRQGSITWGNPTNNASQTFWYRGLPATHPLNTTGEDDADFRYRFIDGPNETSVATNQYRWLVGARGPWRSYEWEAAAGAMGGQTRMDQRGWYSASGFRQVVGNDDPAQVDPRFFQRGYRIGQTNDAAVINKLFPTYGYRGHVRQVFADGKLSGDIGRMSAGPVTAVVGAELRHESFTVDPSAALRAGDIVGNGLSASDAKRLVASTFGEVSLPLATGFDAQLAARLDKHGSTEAHLSPKLALRYSPNPAWLLRGTVEGGFRAPNLTESAPSTKFSFDNGVPDPRRCPQASALARDLRARAQALPGTDPNQTLLLARADSVVNSECSASLASIVSNNPALAPETSRSATIGLVLTPAPRWRLAADAWLIERRNEIGLKDNRELLNSESQQPPGTVNRAGFDNDRSFSAAERLQYGVTAGSLVSTVGRFENVARTRMAGVDLLAQAGTNTPWGSLDLSMDALYQQEVRFWSTVRSGWGDNLAGRGYPRWKSTLSAALTTQRFTHSLRAITTGGTSLQGDFFDTTYTPEGCAAQGYSEGDCRVAGFTRWDYAVEYRPTRALTVSASVYNLFKRQKGIAVASWLNAGGILPPSDEDPMGRMLRVTMEYRWQ